MTEESGSAPGPAAAQQSARYRARLAACRERAAAGAPPLIVEGRLRRSVGLTMEAEGCHAPLGGRCDIVCEDGRRVETEVVGFAGERLFLMPAGEMAGIVPNARVIPRPGGAEIPIGDDLLGRVLDGRGRPLDGAPPPRAGTPTPLVGRRINPLARQPIRAPLDVGVRSINALLSLGRGQRMGLFAGSGVGKSMLLGMMTRNTNADVVVVGLIGERGREVQEFIEQSLGEEGMQKAVVVATPADDPPLSRLHGAWLSAAIAEHFRARGRDVLLLMDSLTRFAHAQREIALAIGEPPATKGYPPSVFAKLPQLVERAGNGAAGAGSITAIYTVLLEGDDHGDPIVDAARAILDGHITLSRHIADAGLYPAVDVEASVSRALPQITEAAHQALIGRFRRLYAIYQEHRDLIAVGAYQRGADPRVDEAVARWPAMLEFLRQHQRERVDFAASVGALERLLAAPAGDAPAPTGETV